MAEFVFGWGGRLRRCAVSLDCGCAEIADVLGVWM